MFQVNFTTPAAEDLLSTLKYISDVLKSPIAAKNLLDDIEQQIQLLVNNPYCFSIVRDEYLGKKGIRYLTVKNYLIFYTVEDDDKMISIIRILYGRRDWINLLKDNSKK